MTNARIMAKKDLSHVNLAAADLSGAICMTRVYGTPRSRTRTSKGPI